MVEQEFKMAVPRPPAVYFVIVLAALCLCGCSRTDVGSRERGGSAWDDPIQVVLLEPFQGKWRFDQERTLAQRQAEGMPEAEINRLRELYENLAKTEVPPESLKALQAAGVDAGQFMKTMSTMHPDLTFQGHVAICDGFPSGEYRLFGIHKHEEGVCGKAWHHEDRFDLGDMSKCYLRLAMEGEELRFCMRMQDGWPSDDDPDLREELPILAGSDTACDADKPAGSDWGPWSTYVFVRSSSQ
jgi:hypothetical protein